MKKLILALLLVTQSLTGKGNHEVDAFLSSVLLDDQAQYERIELVLESLLSLREDDLEVIASFIWASLVKVDHDDDSCACQSCCSECALWNPEKD